MEDLRTRLLALMVALRARRAVFTWMRNPFLKLDCCETTEEEDDAEERRPMAARMHFALSKPRLSLQAMMRACASAFLRREGFTSLTRACAASRKQMTFARPFLSPQGREETDEEETDDETDDTLLELDDSANATGREEAIIDAAIKKETDRFMEEWGKK